jgi:predicted TIM-barrel fold metal-dependent hydrolase
MHRIDTHAHVFRRDLPVAPDARYRPDYDATLASYLGLLDAHGLAGSVLVQPSFLGLDNRHLLACLALASSRLRGVVVTTPETPEEELASMARAGVVGLRFNMIGQDDTALEAAKRGDWLTRVARLGWHLEIHAEAGRLAGVLGHLAAFEGPVVIDHLGRPDPDLGTVCRGFATLLGLARDPRVHVKLSAPYRLGRLDLKGATRALLDAYGPDRLVWGSDWPWTQHEAGRDYAALQPAVFGIDAVSEARLHATASRLFRFTL